MIIYTPNTSQSNIFVKNQFNQFLTGDLLINFDNSSLEKTKKVAIYGSGSAAIQLAAALKVSERNKVVCFIDDIPANEVMILRNK